MQTFAAIYSHRSLYLPFYRGYGASTGRPSERKLLEDALTTYDIVCERHSEVVVIGRSLGAAVATYVASQRNVSSLALITPFDSYFALIRQRTWLFVAGLFVRNRFEAWRWASEVQAPVTVISVLGDRVIPKARTDSLFRVFNSRVERIEILGSDAESIFVHKRFADTLRTIRIA